MSNIDKVVESLQQMAIETGTGGFHKGKFYFAHKRETQQSIWKDSELIKFLERTDWQLWEEVDGDKIPNWLQEAMKKRHIKGVIALSSQEQARHYTFLGHHFIYKVYVSYHGFSIKRQPRGLEEKLPELIQSLKD